MRPIATDVAHAWSVCLHVWCSHGTMFCGKTNETEFGGGVTLVDPTNLQVLDVDQGRPNPFAGVWSDKSTMRPFAKLLWTLVFLSK